MSDTKLRVVIVDDSSFVRIALRRMLAEAGFDVVGVAKDGVEGIELVRKTRPDVVSLDVNMPGMQGTEVLDHILAEQWVPVVMCSTLTKRGADITLECLSRGAVDFVTKPERREDWDYLARVLPMKLRIAARAKPPQKPSTAAPRHTQVVRSAVLSRARVSFALGSTKGLVLIAASTGGPRAVEQVVSALPGDLPFPVIVVQHMPAGFTASFAERLNSSCQLACKEAEEGERLEPGKLYVAPGGYHLVIDNGLVKLSKDPPVWGVRPAADVTFKSVVSPYGPQSVVVVLTGMGCDGAEGARELKAVGATVIAESENTAVIYGMPKAVAEIGAASRILDIDAIPGAVVQAVEQKVAQAA
ncbi:MAG: chemotaxis response regulator protein-glutamate methylesterase [Armatimonadetes bacterium]|nr:chemotaxis response regulator protein-glutamate methylesterase [Armatimonadota bacterium]